MKQNIPFVKDSFENHTVKTLINSRNLCKNLVNFEKDEINEETIELLAPYINLELPTINEKKKIKKVFDPRVAKMTSAALDGICAWVGAINDYHKYSQIQQNFELNKEMNM